MRHFVATKKLSKKPRWETPSDLRVPGEKQNTFHAKSQSSLRKGNKNYFSRITMAIACVEVWVIDSDMFSTPSCRAISEALPWN